MKYGLVVACVLFSVAAGAAIMAFHERNTAKSLERIAQAKELVARAASLLETENSNPELALLLGLEAGKKARRELALLLGLEEKKKPRIAEVHSLFITAGLYRWPTAILAKDELHGETPNIVALSPDGNHLAVLAGKYLSLWDVSIVKPQRKWEREWERELKPDNSTLVFHPSQQLLVIGQEASLDLLDIETGDVKNSIPLKSKSMGKVVFSQDGEWLASAHEDNEFHILDYSKPDVDAKVVKTKKDVGLSLFTIVDKGTLTLLVVSRSLDAYAYELQADGSWKGDEINFSTCAHENSVSLGQGYVSATWKAKTCIFDVITKEEKEEKKEHGSSRERPEGQTLQDVVLSQYGSAFVKVTTRGDLLVGVGTPIDNVAESRIKGAKVDFKSDLTQSISVSEQGTRVAVIDKDELVKIYSVSTHKPLLSLIDSQFAVAPEGEWMAGITPTVQSESGKTLSIVSLKPWADPGRPAVTRHPIDLPGTPSRMCPSRDSITVELGSTPMWIIYDVVTGKEIHSEPKTGDTLRPECVNLTGDLRATSDPSGTCNVWRSQEGADVADREGEVSNPPRGYKIHWTTDKNGQFAAELAGSPVNPLGNKCSIADNRWLAYWGHNSKRVDLLDLRQGKEGEVVWEFEADEDVSDVEFEANNSLVKVRFQGNKVMLIPVEADLLRRYVKWLAPRELTNIERCEYALEECVPSFETEEGPNAPPITQ